jgi:hypothetical protein
MEVRMRKAVITSSLLSLATIGLLTGCPDRTISEVNPEQGRVEFKDIPVNLNRNVDILFVVDDSGSMADKQANLKSNFPKFIEVLNTIQGGLPDVHIGVVTSDVGVNGEDDAAPGTAVGTVGNGGCAGTGKGGNLTVSGAPVTGTFLSDIKQSDGSRVTNYTGDLATVFGQMATVGATGCGFEQHLQAMRRALENNPSNAGFLRADAFLAVIFLADEDDCSMAHSSLLGGGDPDPTLGPKQSFRCTRFGVTCDVGGSTDAAMNQIGVKDQCHPNDASLYLQKVQKYVDFLKTLKGDPSKVIVAGIIGTTDPFAVESRTTNGVTAPALAHSCTYDPDNNPSTNNSQVADPPTRIQFFLDQFPNRSTATTICQQDLSGGLQLIAELLKAAIGDPCINGTLADVDPNTPGDQFDCQVSYVNNFGKPNAVETVLPECNDALSNKPCWHLIVDPAKCPTGSNLILKIEDPNTAPDGTHIIANCVTKAIPAP